MSVPELFGVYVNIYIRSFQKLCSAKHRFVKNTGSVFYQNRYIAAHDIYDYLDWSNHDNTHVLSSFQAADDIQCKYKIKGFSKNTVQALLFTNAHDKKCAPKCI